MKLIAEKKFKKAFKRLVKKNPSLKDQVLNILDILEIDPFTSSLKTHKLKGNLSQYWSCSVTYDCRLIFTFVQAENSDETFIILVDIGSHDEVY